MVYNSKISTDVFKIYDTNWVIIAQRANNRYSPFIILILSTSHIQNTRGKDGQAHSSGPGDSIFKYTAE